jgi:8-oxo-dGTP pyrophosphatase MutT (NUDIX family)
MDTSQLSNLPSTFYRVAVKVIIFDELGRLLVVQAEDGDWEIPGGGWEHDESIERCVQREMAEELQAEVSNISRVEFILQGKSEKGFRVLRLAVRAVLVSDTLVPSEDIVAYKYVNRHDFLHLNVCPVDRPFQAATDEIWGE